MVVWTKSLDRPCLGAKESNQVKSEIGRSRRLRLDSTLLGLGFRMRPISETNLP